MPRQERFESLKAKHQVLDLELQTEGVRPYPDTARILSLKREKLRLKDEMERMSATA